MIEQLSRDKFGQLRQMVSALYGKSFVNIKQLSSNPYPNHYVTVLTDKHDHFDISVYNEEVIAEDSQVNEYVLYPYSLSQYRTHYYEAFCIGASNTIRRTQRFSTAYPYSRVNIEKDDGTTVYVRLDREERTLTIPHWIVPVKMIPAFVGVKLEQAFELAKSKMPPDIIMDWLEDLANNTFDPIKAADYMVGVYLIRNAYENL